MDFPDIVFYNKWEFLCEQTGKRINMNEEMILKFIKKIVECNNPVRIRLSVTQLAEILERDQVDARLVYLVKQMANYQPELLEISKQNQMTKEDLEVAIRRAQTRIENERRQAGRC